MKLRQVARGVVLALAAVGGAAESADASFLSQPVGKIVDKFGRTRLFHGVNTVEKVAPYLPPRGTYNTLNSLGEKDAQQLQAWGFNMVRLGVMWPATFPDDHITLNATYLDEVKSTVELLADYGIYTLIDLHQDLLSPFMCGEGIPDWAHERALELENFDTDAHGFPKPLQMDIPLNDNNDYPNTTVCMQTPFFEYYFSFEVLATFKSLYSQEEMFGYFADHWGAVASALRGTRGLLGYELMNEPFASKGEDDSTSVLSDEVLTPMYQAAHDRIREVDTDALVFFEPLVLTGYLSVINKYTTFPEGGPFGAEWTNRSVFAYHSYCSSAENGDPSPWGLCEVLVKEEWDGFAKDLDKLQTGGFLTEFGAVGNTNISIELIDLQTKHADDLLQSWSYWTYKSFDDITTQNPSTETFFDDDGALQTAKVSALARTYAQVIAGEPVSMSFDRTSAVFELKFNAKDEIDGAMNPTEVFLHKSFHYSDGYDVTLEPTDVCLSWNVKEEGTDWAILEITHDLTDGTQVTVTVAPASS